MTTTERPPLDQTTDAIENAALQVLRVRRGEARALPPGTQTHHLIVRTTPGWPDGHEVTVAIHRRGQGPSVLLVHGKQSQAADFEALADALVAQGFTVWAPDMPGHGHSPGEYLSLPLAARILREVTVLSGPLTLAVGHSFGAACVVQAMYQGLQPQRAALIASPTHYGAYARFTAQRCGLGDADIPAFVNRLHEIIGDDPDAMDMRRQVGRINTPTLVLHSDDDQVVPSAAMEGVAARWPTAHWQALSGLGHFKILQAPEVLQAVTAYARNGPATP